MIESLKDNIPFDATAFLKTVTSEPGVYRMYGQDKTVIYVGKAKDLKKRLSSYFRSNITHLKTKALVHNIRHIDVTVTHSETDALILEHNYIKQYMPKYNVLLRDDKSYPYILLTAHKHPKIGFYRGAKRKQGEYFGPYPESGAVRESLHLLQKLFPIRQCDDSTYANRARPCLMYQIKRCVAPCVSGYISDEEYQLQVNYVRLFLQGKDRLIVEQLIEKMAQASNDLAFEKAASYRDQIQSLRRVQQQQTINDQSDDDIDFIGFSKQNELVCIHMLMLRQGKILGSRSYFPKIPSNTDDSEIMSSFLYQYYLNQSQGRLIPNLIISDVSIKEDQALFISVVSHLAGRKIQLQMKPTGSRARFFKLAQTNAIQAVTSKLNSKMTVAQRYIALKKALNLDCIERMECFDISHTMGESTVASCVVFNHEGPYKPDYRRYNITGIVGGDDYAAMAQVLERRYSKLQDPDKIPDIIFIDGGKGQLSRALAVISRYSPDWPKQPLLIGIAKGVTRKAGLETLVRVTGETFTLKEDSAALHLIQHIRDESHRHAIGGHRLKRDKTRKTSALEQIEGIGAKRRQALLHYMGGLQELSKASIEEIAKVPGISKKLAEVIYDALKH